MPRSTAVRASRRSSAARPPRGEPLLRHPAADSVGRVAAAIRRGIEQGQFAPGQRLIEADLSAELGVKRGPVREALRILAGDGIVELVPQKGARVRKLALQDVDHLLPVLVGLLRLKLELGVVRASKAPFVKRLDEAMEGIRQARRAEDVRALQLAGLHYADVLTEAAANPYLAYLHSKLYAELFYRQVGDLMRIVDWDGELEHYEAMHRACRAGDTARALRLVDAQAVMMRSRLTRSKPA